MYLLSTELIILRWPCEIYRMLKCNYCPCVYSAKCHCLLSTPCIWIFCVDVFKPWLHSVLQKSAWNMLCTNTLWLPHPYLHDFVFASDSVVWKQQCSAASVTEIRKSCQTLHLVDHYLIFFTAGPWEWRHRCCVQSNVVWFSLNGFHDCMMCSVKHCWILLQEGHDCEDAEFCPYLHESYTQVTV